LTGQDKLPDRLRACGYLPKSSTGQQPLGSAVTSQALNHSKASLPAVPYSSSALAAMALMVGGGEPWPPPVGTILQPPGPGRYVLG